ncbi:hypothetical protein OA50_05641 [Mameliella alba]|uniref:Uncharacterized protein n=1 Tax=Mameliella alba TaxID=561184 RepID=A0A0B3REZ8_9RHOB|nr:hypothetical protein OA50_05641 [Mameliella alba]
MEVGIGLADIDARQQADGLIPRLQAEVKRFIVKPALASYQFGFDKQARQACGAFLRPLKARHHCIGVNP